MHARYLALIWGALLVCWLAVPTAARANCLDPRGDINESGFTDVTDVQCQVLISLWELQGKVTAVPPCLKADIVSADLNCDAFITVADVQLSALLALKTNLPLAIDADQNGCVDICERDTDDDGQPDFTDCAPNDPTIFTGAVEVCNGIDDNCSGFIDDLPASVIASCSDNDVCNGIETCPAPPTGLGLMISEIMLAPQAVSSDVGQWIEFYNPSDAPLDIQGWRLVNHLGQTHIIANSGPLIVPRGGHLVLARSTNILLNGGVVSKYQFSGLTLPATGGTISLRTPANAEVDRVDYNSATYPILAGASIALRDPALNNNIAASWATSTLALTPGGDKGTPGGPNRDVFTAPTCQAGSPLVCNDGVDCTADSCHPIDGCEATPFDAACSDNVACTTDVCEATTGCINTPVNAVCDDDVPCTTDVCDAISGCVVIPQDAFCDDNVACTVDTCLPELGCQNVASNALCDDNNACTDDVCDPIEGCSTTPDDALCNDGIACTTDTCDPDTGCAHAGVNALCNDNNPCTIDACLPGVGCTYTPDPGAEGCLPAGALCAISGTAGAIVECPLLAARATAGTPTVGALQFTTSFDPLQVSILGAQDDVCTGPGGAPPCTTVDVPPAQLDPSGHAVFFVPDEPTSWPGQGSLFIFNFNDPSAVLSAAYFTGGSLVGQARFASLKVQLQQAIAPNAPVYIWANNIFGSSPDASPMVGQVQAGVMTLSTSACGSIPGVCDDGEVCTTDSCDLTTGLCVNAPVQCSDGNACNGLEACVAGFGCAPGTPPNCNDGVACTVDSCDPAVGCVNAPSNALCPADSVACTVATCDAALGCLQVPTDTLCDDNVACTVDTCDATTGCGNAPSNMLCDDDIACTTDTCHPTLGCQYAPQHNVCNDGDPCTVDTCAVGQGCTYAASNDLSCYEGDTICVFSGAAGTTVECPIRVARATPTTPSPASLRFALQYNPAAASALGFVDEVCIGIGGTPPCFDSDVPPSTLSPSGHSLLLLPSDPLAWNGNATVVALNPGDPSSLLSEAYFAAQQVVGEATVVRLRMQLTADVPALNPTRVRVPFVEAATTQAEVLQGAVQSGVLTVSLPDCTSQPGVCDDQDVCTTATCNAQTGKCEYVTQVCADDNYCNGTELCIPGVGCQLSGAAAPADCDDNNPCTIDVCDPDQGCVHTHSGDPGCLPPGVFCSVSGEIGSEALCSIHLARIAQATPTPSSVQFGVAYDSTLVQPIEFFGSACLGAGGTPPCVDLPTPPNGLTTGHSVFLGPQNAENWLGAGTVLLFHPADPSAAVSEAYLGMGGAVVGTSQILSMRVRLLQNIPSGSGANLQLQNVLAFTTFAESMTGNVVNGVMVVDVDNCSAQAGYCDDGDACTVDTCNANTGACSYAPLDCSDGNACTINNCSASTGCLAPVAVNCNDNIECTTDSCDPATGCVNAPNNLACADETDCTVDACEPGVGCTNTPSAALCDDNVSCTVDACDPLAGCSNTPSHALCDDGFACTSETCHPTNDCVYVPSDAACNDGDPCTIDECNVGTGCAYSSNPAPECLAPGAICTVSGTAGDVVVCPLRIARATQTTPVPVAAQAVLGYAPNLLKLSAISVEICLDPMDPDTCFLEDAPPANLGGGHTVGLAPSELANWFGFGGIFLFNPTDPAAPVNQAYRSAGDIVGNAEVVRLSFQLQSNINPSFPAYVQLESGFGATATGLSMAGNVEGGVLLLSAPDCTAIPGVCNDGDPCTTNACDTVSGQCVTSPVICADNDFCNGTETCVSGNCVAGAPPSCDDGNPCTVDSCDPLLGCVHTYVPTAGCLPPGAFCSVSGAAGSQHVCSIQVARATITTPPPAALQTSIQFNAAQVQPLAFADTICLGAAGAPPCFEQTSPDLNLYPSGHLVVPAPQNLGAWSGQGSVFFFNPSSPTSGLTEAYLDAQGAVQGAAEVVRLNVQLTQNVPANSPTLLTLSGIFATTGLGVAMASSVQDGLVILAVDDCSTDPGICNDGNFCNGIETCQPGLGCVAGEPLVCNDGIACTVDTCVPSEGCVFTPVNAACNDNVACTSDTCDTSLGCVNSPNDSACDDNVACTIDICDTQLGCTNTPDDAACDDDFVCTLDTCLPGSGCAHAPTNALCDDGNSCTMDTCVDNFGCDNKFANTSECLPLQGFCAVAGSTGQVVSCPLLAARATQGTPAPVGLQARVVYNQALIRPVALRDESCFGPMGGPPCIWVDLLAGNTLFPSGHAVIAGPPSLANWQGIGTLFAINPGDPTAALNSAYLSAGAVVNQPELFRVDFEVLTAISTQAPASVGLTNLAGVGIQGELMPASLQQGIVVVSAPSCVSIANACDDGEVCTVDTCNAQTGQCEYAPLLCADNNACNGNETCQNGVGCVSGIPLVCNDNNPCTMDSCIPATGCAHIPTLDEPSCLPTSAVCAVSGAADSMARCSLQMARATQGTPSPASLQLRLHYDGGLLEVVSFEDLICLGEGGAPPCIPVTTPNLTLFPSGHLVVTAPQSLANWAGAGSLFLFNPSDPSSAITEAYLQADTVQGDSYFLDLNVRLLATIAPASPALVSATDIVGTTALASTMQGAVDSGVIVMDLAECSENPSICDDGDACTDDICQVSTGLCLHQSTNCDDGIGCTLDSCDSALGCINSPVSAVCNDGVACTTDVCDPMLGCLNTPAPTPDCWPTGAFCALTGAAGELKSCSVRLVRDSIAVPQPTGAQLELLFDGSRAAIPALPASLPTGHMVLPAPGTPDTWQGSGWVFLFDPSSPLTSLTSAYQTAGGVTGESELFTFTVELLDDAPAHAPVYVSYGSTYSVAADGQPLVAEPNLGVVVIDVAPSQGD